MHDPFSASGDVTPSDFCVWDPSICSGGGGGTGGGYSSDSWGSVNPSPFDWSGFSTGVTKILGGVSGVVQAGKGRGGPYGGPYGSGAYPAQYGYGQGGISAGISSGTLLIVVALAAVFLLARR